VIGRDAEAGHQQGLDVTDGLLRGTVQPREHVELVDLTLEPRYEPSTDHPRDRGEGPLDLDPPARIVQVGAFGPRLEVDLDGEIGAFDVRVGIHRRFAFVPPGVHVGLDGA
jgi:hypothetical protein